MATSIQNLVPPFFCYKSSFPSLSSPIAIFQRGRSRNARKMLRVCRAMVEKTVQGASSTFAKDMERLSAKESLLLAFKDAGGFEALVTGRTTDVQCIDVNERIIGLERLNPTPRPTTCPNLEGRWNFEWFGVGSPVLVLAKFLFGVTSRAETWYDWVERGRNMMTRLCFSLKTMEWLVYTLKEASKSHGYSVRRWKRRDHFAELFCSRNYNKFGRYISIIKLQDKRRAVIIIPE
ncbi:putative plastid-lipid-associated protein 13, chloroplastic [Capsicum annuum]|nr:putative plastid-lipid-associated protein 13, chloroplastic [Capsicum annuum]